MQTFEHRGKQYITINGKEFYLLQGFKASQKHYRSGEFVFLQVAGKTPLNYEDLPDKNWEIIKTRTQQGIVYTAYNRNYFDYDTPLTERTEAKEGMVFVGRNATGSFYLAMYVCARLLKIQVSENDLKAVAKNLVNDKEMAPYPFEAISDKGNEENTAFYIAGVGDGYRKIASWEFDDLMQKIKPTKKKGGR